MFSSRFSFFFVFFSFFTFIFFVSSTGLFSSVSDNNLLRDIAFKELIRSYSSGNLLVKRSCVERLGFYRREEGVSILLDALGSNDYELFYYARQSLLRIKDYSFSYVLGELDNSDSILLRRRLVSILGVMGDSRGVLPLISAFNREEDIILRSLCIKSLGEIGDNRVLDFIIKGLSSSHWRIRASSAKALGVMGDSGAIMPLISSLDDVNSLVKIHCAWSLGRLKDSRAVPFLIKALTSGNIESRETVVWALGRIRDRRAIKPLLYLLVKDPSFSVRREARESLKYFGFSSDDIDDIVR